MRLNKLFSDKKLLKPRLLFKAKTLQQSGKVMLSLILLIAPFAHNLCVFIVVCSWHLAAFPNFYNKILLSMAPSENVFTLYVVGFCTNSVLQ